MSSKEPHIRDPRTDAAPSAVPPHPFDAQWYAHVAGQTYGPFSGHEIRRMVQQRQILEMDFLCLEGESAWVQAKNDPIIGAVFADRHEIRTVASSALNFGRSTSSARSSSGPIGLKLTLVASLVAWVVLAATGSNNTHKSIERAAPVEKPKSKPLRERGAHIPIDADADAQDSAGVGEEITGKQIDAAVAIVRQHGYRCDSVTGMLPFVFSVRFTLICNDHRYKYELADKGGNWVVTVVR